MSNSFIMVQQCRGVLLSKLSVNAVVAGVVPLQTVHS